VQEHLLECGACEAERGAVERVDGVLRASMPPVDATAMSQRVLARAVPVLQKNARAAWRRQVAAGLLVATLPLPAVLLFDAYLLRLLYGAIGTLLSTTLAAYVVLTYAAILTLLFALTYAAIPIFLARAHGSRLAPR
jgi:hypothetical protein